MTSQQATIVTDWLSHLGASPPFHPSSPCTATCSLPPSTSPTSPSPTASILGKRKNASQGSAIPAKRLRPARLTRQALRAMTGNEGRQGRRSFEGDGQDSERYAQQVSTPPKPPIASSASVSVAKTPSKTPSTSSNKVHEAKLPKNVLTVRESLARHWMRIHDRAALDRCADFKKKIDKLFARERPSRMSDKSAKAAVRTLYKHYAQNEKTLFREFRPHVIKSTRTVSTLKRDMEGEIIRILQAYDDDGLMVIEDCPFVKDMVPGKNYTSEEKAMGLTEPKPDLTYGIQKPEFPPIIEAKLKMRYQAWRSVAPGMDWPFFVIEHKGCEDSIAQAENQAMRDGAVLVNARKKLNEELQPADYVRPIGADEDTFVFSCPWQSDQAKIYVHWFEKLEDGTEIFQMTRMRGYQMEDEGNLAEMRKDLHNILDWGLFEFRLAAEDVWKKILARA